MHLETEKKKKQRKNTQKIDSSYSLQKECSPSTPLISNSYHNYIGILCYSSNSKVIQEELPDINNCTSQVAHW